MRPSRPLAWIFALLGSGFSIAACGLDPSIDSLFGDTGSGAAGGGGGSSSTSTSTSTSTSSTSTSSTSTSSTSTSSTSTSTSTSSSGNPLPEDCENGIDDNNDGLVDCADPQCTDYTCVDAAPSGWVGFGWVHLAGFPDNPAPCDDGSAPVKLFAGPAGPAQCTQCTCGDLQGGSCSLPKVECWAASAGCAGNAIDVTATFSDGQCHKPTNQLGQLGFPAALSCQMSGQGQVANSGACPPSAVDFPNKATWGNQLNVCVSDNKFGGCTSGKTCIRKGQGDASEKLCIRKNGTANACPAGWNTLTQAYQGGTDTRSCTGCQCGNPSNVTCNGGSVTFFDADLCQAGGNDPPKTFNSTNGCTDVSNLLDFNSWSASASLPMPTGSCQPGGGQPQGQVQTSNAVAFCCK